ncbi:hypothetical protein niasHT_026567 [Heterodera trifolii]|uniref:Hexosyltransferase n=1 Tax=Heterodera trifolii TaxID=157864 RepID=A0ABD2KST9_9BILA
MAFQIRMVLLCFTGFVLIYHLYTTKQNEWKDGGRTTELNATEELYDYKTQRNFLVRFKNIRLKYRMEFANACPDGTKLIMLSMARRDGFDKRKGVRQTWMNDSLDEEQRKHGDLVFLHGFEDKYKHIHLKWFAALQWQQSFCKSAEWVMKADDDAVVHLRRLSHWVDAKFRPLAAKNPLIYFGLVLFNPNPIRNTNSKWYISEDVYPLDWFPSFMQGTVYLTTPATIRAVLARAKEIVGFYLDDVLFTGILADLANVKLSDHRNHFLLNFSLDERNGECVNGTPTAISMYGVSDFNGYVREYKRLNSIECKR